MIGMHQTAGLSRCSLNDVQVLSAQASGIVSPNPLHTYIRLFRTTNTHFLILCTSTHERMLSISLAFCVAIMLHDQLQFILFDSYALSKQQ